MKSQDENATCRSPASPSADDLALTINQQLRSLLIHYDQYGSRWNRTPVKFHALHLNTCVLVSPTTFRHELELRTIRLVAIAFLFEDLVEEVGVRVASEPDVVGVDGAPDAVEVLAGGLQLRWWLGRRGGRDRRGGGGGGGRGTGVVGVVAAGEDERGGRGEGDQQDAEDDGELAAVDHAPPSCVGVVRRWDRTGAECNGPGALRRGLIHSPGVNRTARGAYGVVNRGRGWRRGPVPGRARRSGAARRRRRRGRGCGRGHARRDRRGPGRDGPRRGGSAGRPRRSPRSRGRRGHGGAAAARRRTAGANRARRSPSPPGRRPPRSRRRA